MGLQGILPGDLARPYSRSGMNAATQRRVLAQQLHLPLFDTCQRWSGRRTSYRPAGEAFDKRRYGLERIDFGTAKAFVERHHYANTMPAARLQLGLMHKASTAVREQLVGVVVFSVPMQERASDTGMVRRTLPPTRHRDRTAGAARRRSRQRRNVPARPGVSGAAFSAA